jgi:hypothetical protein
MRQSVQEKDHPEKKQQVIVARHHVLGAEVEEGYELHALVIGDEERVLAYYTVRQALLRDAGQQNEGE